MNVTVVYVEGSKKLLQKINLSEAVSVKEVIERSELKRKFPHIDINATKVGIFGKITKLDATISDGDRIEVYRPITADPQQQNRS